MRAAGELIGKSDSYISQIENGRMDIPSDNTLEAMLNAYGPIKVASFKERVRLFKQEFNAREEAKIFLAKLSEEKQERCFSYGYYIATTLSELWHSQLLQYHQ